MPLAEVYRIYLLRPGARPRRHDLLLHSEVERHRNLTCRCYADCLHFVARSPWPSFSCDGCPLDLRQTG